MNSAPASIKLIDVPFASSKTRDRNEENSKTSCTCFLCNKDVVEGSGAFVYYTTTGKLAPVGHDLVLEGTGEDSEKAIGMGLYPVGSECAKKVPAAYRHKG